MRKLLAAMFGMSLLLVTVWLVRGEPSNSRWREAAPEVWQSTGLPCGYALIDGDAVLLIGAARCMDWRGLKPKIERCLLTHHHRDTSALARRRLPSRPSRGRDLPCRSARYDLLAERLNELRLLGEKFDDAAHEGLRVGQCLRRT